MQLGHAVYREAGNDGHLRHAYAPLVEDRHRADLRLVARILPADLRNEAAVDLVDDLVDAGQQAAEQLDRPLLGSFRHDRVVGVGEAPGRNAPGIVPFQPVIVQQDPHQFGDRDGRMRVVQLENDVVRQVVDVVMALHEMLHGALDGRGNEEILLFQTQFLAAHVVVVRVEDLADGLGEVLLFGRAVVVAGVEGAHFQLLDGFGVPQT